MRSEKALFEFAEFPKLKRLVIRELKNYSSMSSTTLKYLVEMLRSIKSTDCEFYLGKYDADSSLGSLSDALSPDITNMKKVVVGNEALKFIDETWDDIE
mmetsp:Transcript_36795/g.33022  ORF Transcript_36795/g.33022 Transcript_36795/m.33022 type:complete len:99 (-) Transcript_36795:147-443(-)